MNLNEFLTTAREALAQTSNDTALRSLVVEAGRMADMVGWATGPIDPHGRIAAVFDTLKQQARFRFAATQSTAVAQLHDALADLINAIVSHDDDLNPDGLGASADD